MILHGRGFNDSTKRAFFALIGEKQPTNISGMQEAIDRWGGITPEERSHLNEEKSETRERRIAAHDLERLKRPAAIVQVDDGSSLTPGDEWIEQRFAQGFNRVQEIPSSGAAKKYALANSEGRGWPIKTELLHYARALEHWNNLHANDISEESIPDFEISEPESPSVRV
jgi:hypothetical protein